MVETTWCKRKVYTMPRNSGKNPASKGAVWEASEGRERSWKAGNLGGRKGRESLEGQEPMRARDIR